MRLTAKRAEKLSVLAMNVTYTANDVAESLADISDRYLTKQEREDCTESLQQAFISLEANFNSLKRNLKKRGVI